MKLSRSLSLAVLYASLVSSATLIDQVQGFPWPWPNHPRTTTIIDLLSTNAEFGPLIKALQRTALIPILNASVNVTLVAPVSDAIENFEGDLTKEILLYHILRGSVLSSMVEKEIVVESLLKMDPRNNRSLGVGVKIEREGDRGRGQGLLRIGGEARVVKSDWEANNGVIQVVDKLMRIPDTIESIIETTRSVSTFNSLYKGTSLPSTYSIFVPDDTSFEELHPVELSYLKTRFAKQDRTDFLERHACHDVLYAKDLMKGGKVLSLEGETIHYETDDNDILVDNANVTQPDIVARNGNLLVNIPNVGVIHEISKLLLPSHIVFTPLKYLYGLHDYIFAETLAASDSFYLANDTTIQQTIFAPIDEAYADSFETKEVLKKVRYNFIHQGIDLRNLKDNDLLETKYTLKSLDGAGQMIKVTKVEDKWLLNNNVEVLPDPVRSGNTTIYEIASRLSPPGPLRPTSSQGLSLFRSFRHLISTNLDQRILFDENAITVLLPVDQAWKTLGLTEKYLLSDTSGDALRQIMLHNILKGVHYLKDFHVKPETYTTLNGDKVTLYSDGDKLVFDDVEVTVDERDILAENGVAHSLSIVPIPPSIIITPKNLINATGSISWLDILHSHNLSSYLDLSSNSTLLIPTDEAISLSPLKTLNPLSIKSLINLHIIPATNGTPPPDLFTSPAQTHITLSGKPISVHKIYSDIYSIELNSSSARILDSGKTSNGAQILLIDQVLFEVDGKTTLRWGKPLAVIIFAIAVTVIVASGVNFVVKRWQRRREMKPLFHSEENGETEPFLNGGTS